MKRYCITLLFLVSAIPVFAFAKAERDTLMKIEKLFILELKRASFIFPYEVSGDIYLTSDSFIFKQKPRPYFGAKRRKSYELIKDLNIPYESINTIKRRFWLIPYMRLIVRTEDAEYKFGYFISRKNNFNIKKTIDLIVKTVRVQKKHRQEQ